MTSSLSLPIAVTIGDPNGIGPEVAMKAAADHAARRAGGLILLGDEHVIRSYHRQLASDFPLAPFEPGRPVKESAVNYLDVPSLPALSFKPGVVSGAAGAATIAYLESALSLARGKEIAAIVGCPHNETAVNAAGIKFSGYPSVLARLTGTPEDRVFLMLVGGSLRILHVTLHERLQTALGRLTPELVEAACRSCIAALRELGIEKPQIGLFGINPHAGEGGLFGDEDDRITMPAAEKLRADGVDVLGPIGADVLLGRQDLDAFVAIYHDQGHIPIKLVSGKTASALTVGAGVLFSSVGHGSAFDIAGQGKANPEGLLRTIALLERKSPGKLAQ